MVSTLRVRKVLLIKLKPSKGRLYSLDIYFIDLHHKKTVNVFLKNMGDAKLYQKF